jgi:hypothetical protein
MRRLLLRRAGPVGLALTAYDIWRRIPRKQRKQIIEAARKHGPRVAAQAVQRGRQRAGSRLGRKPRR